MKNSKFTELLKKNSVVVLTLSGIMIIAIVVMLVTGRSGETENTPNPIDLNNTTGTSETDGGEDGAGSKTADGSGNAAGGEVTADGSGNAAGEELTADGSGNAAGEELTADGSGNAAGEELTADGSGNAAREELTADGSGSAAGGELTADGSSNAAAGELTADGSKQNALEPEGDSSIPARLVGEDEPLYMDETGNSAGTVKNETKGDEALSADGSGTKQGEVGEASVETSVPGTVEEADGELTQETMAAIAALSYDESLGLLWPVKGDIVLNYSVDHLIYYATLNQFRTHSAVAIAAEEGTEVHAAADGIVVSVEQEIRTGTTLTTAIGNDYYLVYGQLNAVDLKPGDAVTAGQVLGTVGTVSRYYTLEGNNLYFQVQNGENTVNPMSLLRDEEEAAVIE